MTPRALLVLSPLALLVCGAAGCGSEDEHPPTVGGCTSNCGGGTGGTADATVDGGDAATDAVFEVGEAGVAATGTIHQLSAFPPDPSSGPLATNITVRALRQGGGTVETLATTGTFTLDGIAPSIGSPTWLSLVSLGTVREIVGVSLTSETTDIGPIPLFDESLPTTTSGLTTLAGTATVVIHVKGPADAGDTRLAGVSAAPIGDVHPYYDSGKDAVESTATATGANGTVVYIGLPPGTAPVTLSYMGTALPTLTIPTAADAISWIAVRVE